MLGDTATLAAGLWIVARAHRLGIPTPVLMKMLANVGVDYAFGTVPLLGDVFDVFWKANRRNVALLEREIARQNATAKLREDYARVGAGHGYRAPSHETGGVVLLDDLEIFGGHFAAPAFNQFVADLLAFGQPCKARLLDGADVHEGILRAVFGFDKAVPLGRVEPFYGSVCHDNSLSRH